MNTIISFNEIMFTLNAVADQFWQYLRERNISNSKPIRTWDAGTYLWTWSVTRDDQYIGVILKWKPELGTIDNTEKEGMVSIWGLTYDLIHRDRLQSGGFWSQRITQQQQPGTLHGTAFDELKNAWEHVNNAAAELCSQDRET